MITELFCMSVVITDGERRYKMNLFFLIGFGLLVVGLVKAIGFIWSGVVFLVLAALIALA